METFTSLLPQGKVVDCLEDLGELTVKELKSILKQYKEKTTGNKADLVLRTFAIFSRAKKFNSHAESDPPNSESFLYCHEKEYTYDFIRQQCSHLPWTSDLRGTPAVSFLQLYEYLVIRTSKFKHILLKSTAYKKLKAFQFFFEGFIKKVDVAKDNNFTFLDVRVKASMKRILYKVIIKLSNKSGDVCSAACSCPAGIGIGGFSNCNHVGGVLFALEDFNRRGLQEHPSAVSCTSKLSAWNVPNASALRSFNPAPIDQIIIKKIKFGKNNDVTYSPGCKSFDPRAASDRVVSNDRFDILKTKLAEAPISADVDSVVTDAKNVEKPCLHEAISFNKHYDISKASFKEMMEFHCSEMLLSEDEILDIEKSTQGQALNSNWIKHRLYRITASNFYAAAVNTVEPSSKLRSMYYKSFDSAATLHGKKFEGHVRELYSLLLEKEGMTANVTEVGLKISPSFPFLGASLDGIVKCANETWGLEIKCPFSKFNGSLKDALSDKKFFLAKDGDNGMLKRRHPYYFQLQGQMLCAKLHRVDFVVWFGDAEPLFIESIQYDEDFTVNYLLPRLKYFFCRAVLPEFFTKRVKNGFKLYLHGGWENYDEV